VRARLTTAVDDGPTGKRGSVESSQRVLSFDESIYERRDADGRHATRGRGSADGPLRISAPPVERGLLGRDISASRRPRRLRRGSSVLEPSRTFRTTLPLNRHGQTRTFSRFQTIRSCFQNPPKFSSRPFAVPCRTSHTTTTTTTTLTAHDRETSRFFTPSPSPSAKKW